MNGRARTLSPRRRAGRVAAAGAIFLVVGAYLAAVVPTRTADAPRRVVWVGPDGGRVTAPSVTVPGCAPVVLDSVTAGNLARAGVPVTADRVGDGSVRWFVAGVFVGHADFPDVPVRACVPAHLVAATEAAQP